MQAISQIDNNRLGTRDVGAKIAIVVGCGTSALGLIRDIPRGGAGEARDPTVGGPSTRGRARTAAE